MEIEDFDAIKTKVMKTFIRKRTVKLFPIFRTQNQMLSSPISLIYIHAMARTAVEDEHLKKRLMSLQIMEKLKNNVGDLEDFLNMKLGNLLDELNYDKFTSTQLVQNKIFFKHYDSLPEYYYTTWDRFYGPRKGVLKNRKKYVKITHKDVNQWVSARSCGTINEVISKRDFDQFIDTSYLLVNCVYFFDDWAFDGTKGRACRKQSTYKSTTLDCTIFVSSLAFSNVSTAFAFSNNVDHLLMFFEKRRPELYELIEEGSLDPSSIDYTLPIGVFQGETRFQNIVFNEDVHDFRGMRSVTQKVYLEITGKGVTAAAVTVLGHSIAVKNEEKEKPANAKPNVFMLYDTFEDMVLFIGSNLNGLPIVLRKK